MGVAMEKYRDFFSPFECPLLRRFYHLSILGLGSFVAVEFYEN